MIDLNDPKLVNESLVAVINQLQTENANFRIYNEKLVRIVNSLQAELNELKGNTEAEEQVETEKKADTDKKETE